MHNQVMYNQPILTIQHEMVNELKLKIISMITLICVMFSMVTQYNIKAYRYTKYDLSVFTNQHLINDSLNINMINTLTKTATLSIERIKLQQSVNTVSETAIEISETLITNDDIINSEAEIETPIIEASTSESIPAGFVYLEEVPLSKELQLYTYNKCQEYNLRYSLVLAIMWRESGFNPNALGYNKWNDTYDSGLMQINDCNKGWLAEQCGITDLFDPYQCIDAGTEILHRLSHNGEHGMLMAYQYGEAGMKKQIAKGVTTNSSIEKAYTKAAEFEEMMNNKMKSM